MSTETRCTGNVITGRTSDMDVVVAPRRLSKVRFCGKRWACFASLFNGGSHARSIRSVQMTER